MLGRNICFLLAAGLGSSPALAQDDPVRPQAQPSGGATGGVEKQVGMDDIVVTAQRRSESLTDVPISVTALSGEALASSGISNTVQLQAVTPGLVMQRFGGFVQPSIRGISTGANGPGVEANVAMYIDGVYQPNQSANTIELPDVARVEVLKGPQGTLSGRNASGGAIRIFTREPSYTATGDFSASYGRFDNLQVKGFVSAPLVADKIAISLSGLYENMDGWNNDLLNGGNIGKVQSRLIRGKLLLEPTDRLKLVFTGQYTKFRDDSQFAYSALNGNTAGADPAFAANGPIATKPYDVSIDFPPRIMNKNITGSLRASYDIDDIGTVSTITAYQHNKNMLSADGDASPTLFIGFIPKIPDKNFMQELNFASEKFGAISFVSGLFYYDDRTGHDPILGFFPSPTVSYARVRTKAYAAYTEANIQITDRLSTIVGARYSHERRSVRYARSEEGLDDAVQYSKSYNSVTPRMSLRYEIEPRTSIYATYSQGFKSGVYNANAEETTPVKPEKVKSYELGIKAAQGNFSLNLAGFYIDYTNLQVSINRGGFDTLDNAGATRNYGAELEGRVRLSPDFTVAGGVAWLHARYHDYTNATIIVPVPGGGNTAVPNVDLSGHQLLRSPNFTFNLNPSYSHEFGFGKVEASSSVYYTASYPLEQSGRVRQKSYPQVNAQINVFPGSSGIRLGIWGKNLTNEKIVSSSLVLAGGDLAAYSPPRTYGVSVGFSF